MADMISVIQQPPAPPVKEEDVRNSRNRKYPRGTDFSKMKLVHADFRGATLVECIFDDADCKYANFQGANCYGARFVGTNLHKANMLEACLENVDFRPRDMFGIGLSFHCRTFANMKVDHEVMKLWFFIPTMWQLPEMPNRPGFWMAAIESVLGKERIRKFRMIFDSRQV